ncbi:MAG: ArsR family transcriptional regulator [Candidatus Thorarchaeota archaeon]
MSDINIIDASRMLTDEYAMKILAGSFHYPKSAQELSKRFNIPIAACYRKIHDLEESGFLECVEKVLSKDGRRVRLYRSQLKGAYLFFENGKLRVCLNLTKVPMVEYDETVDILQMPQA